MIVLKTRNSSKITNTYQRDHWTEQRLQTENWRIDYQQLTEEYVIL